MQNINNRRVRKKNVLLNLIENQPHIDEIYFYAKDPYEAKYKYLINKGESVRINIILMILKLLLSIQMTCAMFTKILIITTRRNKIRS